MYGFHNFWLATYTHSPIVASGVVLANIFSKTNRLCKAAAFYREQLIGVRRVILHCGLLLKRGESMKIGIRPLRHLNNALVLDLCCKQSSTTDSRFSKDQI